MTAHCVLLLIVVKPCPGGEPRCLDQSHFFPKGLLGKEKDFGWWSSVGIGWYTGEVLHGELLAIPLDCKLQANWRASEAGETPSIATYREKCLDGASKPQCACSREYAHANDKILSRPNPQKLSCGCGLMAIKSGPAKAVPAVPAAPPLFSMDGRETFT